MSDNTYYIMFDEITNKEMSIGGGKGSMLAYLRKKGFPVPNGMIILPISFENETLKESAWEKVQTGLKKLKSSDSSSFAVRSSALAEDSTVASFGGQFETVLDVKEQEEIKQAIQTVYESRLNERVQAYSKAKGIEAEHQIAVVIQVLIRADMSGVLFTANPVTQDRTQMVGNYIHGLGELLVSGEADATDFFLSVPNGKYTGPNEFKKYVKQLFTLGRNIEQALGNFPQDIEFAIAEDKLYLLQSRPITTFNTKNPVTFEINATKSGDYLWTNNLMAEVFPKALTPCSWSIWDLVYKILTSNEESNKAVPFSIMTISAIAGRPYLNYSYAFSFASKLLFSDKRANNILAEAVGEPPEGMDVPKMPISFWGILRHLIPVEIKKELRKNKLAKQFRQRITTFPRECQKLTQKIRSIADKNQLKKLWKEPLLDMFLDTFTLQDKANEAFFNAGKNLRNELRKQLDDATVHQVVATMSSTDLEFASLGHLIGIKKVLSGKMSKEEFVLEYGHRCELENYFIEPRPYEDSQWVDNLIKEYQESSYDIDSAVNRRRKEFQNLLEDLQGQYPKKLVNQIKQKVTVYNEICDYREDVRSQLTRIQALIREFLLKARELTDLQDDIFFLTIDEILEVLDGEDIDALNFIPARKETHEKYLAIPTLPVWIRGVFDPISWNEREDKVIDTYDATGSFETKMEEDSTIIRGNPGSAGKIVGRIRKISSPEEGHKIKPGEILLAHTTNVGWTSIFPKAAAVITDIGAVLSHAAIVARELGVPAVVGTGDGTQRLQTGDRVQVDGTTGIIEILEKGTNSNS